jgi:hypothetical protein
METYQPHVFIAPCLESEVMGQAMMMFAEIAKGTDVEAVLQENGLLNISPDAWYPMQSALNVFKALYDEPNSPNYALVSTGMKAIQTLSFPPEVNSIADALRLIYQISKQWARYVPDNFGFSVEILDEGQAHITNNTPVPDSSVYGFIWNIINSRKLPEQIFLVRTLPSATDRPTVFEVTWGTVDDLISG